MELDPDVIKENLTEIGEKEALILLRELIENSADPYIRRRALENYGELEKGKNFTFFENLFFSDEDLRVRLIAGKVLNHRYSGHKKLIPLLEYTLKKISNIELKIFSLRCLSTLDRIKTRKIVMNYLKHLIKVKFKDEMKSFSEEIFNSDYKARIPERIIEICINLILNDYYIRVCGYLSSLRYGKIVSLDCESVNLESIGDIVGIKNLDDLEHLNIQRTKIKSIGNLQHFKKLKHLNLSHNQINKIENLQKLVSLEELNLSYNKIHKIQNLEKLKKLKKLSLNNNSITEIENLNFLTDLEDLNLIHNNISEIKNLEKLESLKRINLSSNKIEKLSGLSYLRNLIWFSINDNKISQISGLSPLNNLRMLYVSNNLIERIEGLENLYNLRRLVLSGNRISNLEGLQTLLELQELYLDNNNIEKLEDLDYLSKLIILHIGRNKILKFRSEYIKNLANLNFLYLNENPLDQQSWEQYKKRFKFP
ncbi:MAG: leucine-rich repeat protein [Promethearchaeota archaeon]|jgi:Leucine-rich repeat (LRR) protein